jgi:hypothetical protein
MKLVITPFKSVGLFKFGMKQEKIDQLFTSHITDATISSGDQWQVIQGSNLYIEFAFDQRKLCNQVVIRPPSECFLDEHELMNIPTKNTQALLEKHGNCFFDSDIMGSFNLCIQAYKKSCDFDEPPEVVAIYRDIESMLIFGSNIALEWLFQILSTKFEVIDSLKKRLESIPPNEKKFGYIIKSVMNFDRVDLLDAWLDDNPQLWVD